MKFTLDESIFQWEGDKLTSRRVAERIARAQDLVIRAKSEFRMAGNEQENWLDDAQIAIGVSTELFEADLTEQHREFFLSTSLSERFKTLLSAFGLPTASKTEIDCLGGATERALAVAWVAYQMELLRHLGSVDGAQTMEDCRKLVAMAHQLESILLETMPRTSPSSAH